MTNMVGVKLEMPSLDNMGQVNEERDALPLALRRRKWLASTQFDHVRRS